MTGLFVAQHAVALEAPALAYMNSTAASAVSPLPPPVKKSANGDEAFPMKLYRMLEDVERNGQQDIIGWNATGDKFIVYQPKVFASTWMLRYFNQSKYKSFQRQLNLYNFRRESQGRIKGIYSHEMFHRGKVNVVRKLRRVVARGTCHVANNNNSGNNSPSLSPISSPKQETTMPIPHSSPFQASGVSAISPETSTQTLRHPADLIHQQAQGQQGPLPQQPSLPFLDLQAESSSLEPIPHGTNIGKSTTVPWASTNPAVKSTGSGSLGMLSLANIMTSDGATFVFHGSHSVPMHQQQPPPPLPPQLVPPHAQSRYFLQQQDMFTTSNPTSTMQESSKVTPCSSIHSNLAATTTGMPVPSAAMTPAAAFGSVKEGQQQHGEILVFPPHTFNLLSGTGGSQGNDTEQDGDDMDSIGTIDEHPEGDGQLLMFQEW